MLVTLVVACVLVGLRFVYREVIYAGKPPGFVEDRSEWPRGLKELISDANLGDSDIDAIRVYRLYDRAWDAEYIWQFDAGPQVVKALVDGRGLTPVAVDGNVAQEFVDKLPTNWSIPDLSQGYEVYSTPGYKATYMEGELFAVILDKDEGRLLVWYTFIF